MCIKIFNWMVEKIDKLSLIEQLVLVVGIMLVTCIIFNLCTKLLEKTEGYNNLNNSNTNFILKQDDDILDDFYVSLYDILEYNKIRNQFEIGAIINTCSPTSKSIILDIGTGTGHHVNQLNHISKQVIGIDTSPLLIKKARENYPNLNFENNDILNNISYNNNSFTHILCLNNTLYHSENKKLFLENCYNWLMPGGYLILRLREKTNFDALNNIKMIRKNIFPNFVNPEILLTDNVKFKNFVYKPEYTSINDSLSIFKEVFKFNNGNIIQNERKLYIPSYKEILNIAQYIGFIELKMFKNTDIESNDKTYLYILQKPN